MTIRQYLSDIHHFLRLNGLAGRPIDDELFVIVAIYMDRLVRRSGVLVTYWNVHRIVAMSTWIACKMQYDGRYNLNRAEAFGMGTDGMALTEHLYV